MSSRITHTQKLSEFGLQQTTWLPFDYNEYICGLCWVLASTPEIDTDGNKTGTVSLMTALVVIEPNTDKSPQFVAVDAVNHGFVPDTAEVIYFANVEAPPIPVEIKEADNPRLTSTSYDLGGGKKLILLGTCGKTSIPRKVFEDMGVIKPNHDK